MTADSPIFPLCDLFSSIQGEGTWTGRAMLFLRFSGCPLSCPWCDEPLHKDPQATRSWTGEHIVKKLAKEANLPHVLLTGGEPLAVQGIDYLIGLLKNQNYWLAMETSGVGGPLPKHLDWITLSPKTSLDATLFDRADEIKYVVGESPSVRQIEEIQQIANSHDNVWIQPRSDGQRFNPLALDSCLEQIKVSGGKIRLSLQTHKLIGLP